MILIEVFILLNVSSTKDVRQQEYADLATFTEEILNGKFFVKCNNKMRHLHFAVHVEL